MTGIAVPYPSFSRQFLGAPAGYVSGGTTAWAHGLGVRPKLVVVEMVCTTAELGYSIGDVVTMFAPTTGGVSASSIFTGGLTVVSDAANVTLYTASRPTVVHKTGNTVAAVITAANWNVQVRAWA